ncbi:MAG: carboxypeptidase-like regulatory domain-containing protein, partial [Thermoanaerobaculia bacterium]
MRGTEISGWEYFGPDEAVLLSASFRETHCFSLARSDKRPAQIGVAFEPLRGRQTSDIAGVFWVNDSSAALTEVEFQYRNAGILSRFRAGGFTRFRRLQSGAVVVDSWELSAPQLEMHTGQSQEIVSNGQVSAGGSILSDAQYASEARKPVAGATIFGLVRGENALPVEGAEIRLSAGPPTAVSDSSGRFRINSLPLGTFVLHVRKIGYTAQD